MSNHSQVIDLIKAFSGQAKILTIPRAFIDVTNDLHSALFLSQVIYWSDKGSRDNDGWFYKTKKEWIDELGFTERIVDRCIKDLKDLGILDTRVKKANGNPTVHYQVNFDTLSRKLLKNNESVSHESYESNLRNSQYRNSEIRSIEPYKFADSLTETTTETTLIESSSKTDSDVSAKCTKQVNGFGVKDKQSTTVEQSIEVKASKYCSKKLHEGLVKKRKLMRSPNLEKWDKEFLTFLREHWEERHRFKKVLEWYLNHVAEPFVPQAYSPTAFIEKFVAIEDAMIRYETPNLDKMTEAELHDYNQKKRREEAAKKKVNQQPPKRTEEESKSRIKAALDEMDGVLENETNDVDDCKDENARMNDEMRSLL